MSPLPSRSRPGHLHDLLVTLDAMSPGEVRTGGKGLEIEYGTHTTPLGECLIATTSRGICNLHFLDTTSQDAAEIIGLEWPNADIVQDQQGTQGVCDRIFADVANKQPVALYVKGTDFQIQVWRALLTVPFGEITTYQVLAQALGRPTAARAVGNAVGRNPVGYLIPCHRVIRESGELGGFRWGLHRKTVLLDWEASQSRSIL